MGAAAQERIAQVTTAPEGLLIEVSPGELIDRLTILAIKADRLTDETSLNVVRAELAKLHAIWDKAVSMYAELDQLVADLRQVNEGNWDAEETLRLCERERDFSDRFIVAARSVYLLNDKRSLLKRRVNDQLGSVLREEKGYAAYGGILPTDYDPLQEGNLTRES